MPRLVNQQQLYDPAPASGQVSLPGAPHVPAPAQAEGAGSRLLSLAAGAGLKGVELLARDYVREEQARADDALLEAGREFEIWKTEYMKNNQGRDALSAQADFARAYDEISARAMENFGGRGNEIFRAGLQSRLDARGLQAVAQGGRYQLAQDEAWQKSQWQAQISDFQRQVENNARDPDYLNFISEQLLQSWEAKNPGLDSGAARDRIMALRDQGRVETLLAGGDYAGARALLGGHAGAGAADTTGADITGMDENIAAMIRAAAKRHNVPEELALACAMQESGGNPKALSKAGARGVMQLMPGTARDLGVNPDDPAQNIDGGVRYLGRMLRKFGNARDALTAYNWGPGAMERHISGGRSGAMPQEAREYAGRVLGRMGGGQAAASGASGASAIPGSPGRDSLPGLTAAQKAAYRAKIDAAEKRRQAELRAGLSVDLEDFFARAHDGQEVDPPDRSLVAAAFGDKAPQMLERINSALAFGRDLRQLRGMSAAEQDSMLAAAKPDAASRDYAAKKRLYEERLRMVAADRKAREADPAAYAALADPAVMAARQALLRALTPENAKAYLTALGAAYATRDMEGEILSKADAQALAGMAAQSPEPAAFARKFDQAFGALAPRVLGQIAGKMAPLMSLVATSGMPDEAGRLVLDAGRDQDFDKKALDLLRIKGADKSDFESSVAEALGDIERTFLAGGDSAIPLALRDATGKLAMQHMLRQGLEMQDAVERAASEVILDRYSVLRTSGGHSFRAPKSLDPDALEEGAAREIKNLSVDDLCTRQLRQFGADRQERMYRSILENAYWVTNGDESGAILFHGGRAVLDKNGRPVARAWRDLADAALEREEIHMEDY